MPAGVRGSALTQWAPGAFRQGQRRIRRHSNVAPRIPRAGKLGGLSDGDPAPDAEPYKT